MKRIFFLFCLLLSFSFSAFAQEKKDTLVAKKKHIFSISFLNELNYSNDQRIAFREFTFSPFSPIILYDQPAYSYSYGVTINWKFKYFSIGTGLMCDKFSFTYYYTPTQLDAQNVFFFTGIPIIPDFFYTYKRFSFHFIPEIRAEILTSAYLESSNGIKVFEGFNYGFLLLACPKIGISYNISKAFSLSAYCGIKCTLSPISTNINARTYLYSCTTGLGINYRF
jgi:hypothetical protein